MFLDDSQQFECNSVIGFATGSMIHDGFKVAQIFEINDDAHACYGVLYMITALAHLVFTFLQTHFIFKNHKVSDININLNSNIFLVASCAY